MANCRCCGYELDSGAAQCPRCGEAVRVADEEGFQAGEFEPTSPSVPRAEPSALPWIATAGGAAMVLVLMGAGILGFFLFRSSSEPERIEPPVVLHHHGDPLPQPPSDPDMEEASDPWSSPTDGIKPLGSIAPPKVLKRAKPEYPAEARAKGLTGKVTLELIIDEKGHVADARVLKSTHEVFDQPSLDAVRKWTFSPPLTGTGQPVMAYHVVTFRFSL